MRNRIVCLATLVVLALPLASQGGLITWQGDTSTDWNVGGNWEGGAIPGSANTALFTTGSVSIIPTLFSDAEVAGIRFGATGFSINGPTRTLTLGVGDSTTDNYGIYAEGTGTNTINPSIRLAGNSTWCVTEGILTLNGTVSEVNPNTTLTKEGAGVLNIVTGAFTGAFTINEGMVRIAGAGIVRAVGGGAVAVNDGGYLATNGSAATLTNPVDVNTGGYVGGRGVFSGAVTVDDGGFLRTGFQGAIYDNTRGTVTFTDTLTLNGTYIWGMGGDLTETYAANTSFDRVVISGGALGGSDAALTVNLSSAAADPDWATFWSADHTWTIITGASINPFDDTELTVVGGPGLPGTATWSTVLNGSNIDLHYTAVPEPATMAFLVLGGLALAGGAIRRRRRA